MFTKNSLSYFLLQRLIFSKRSSSLIRRISLLSFIGISLSVSFFFLVLFIMNGMNRNIKNRLLSIDPHISVYFPKEIPANEVKILNEFAQNNELKSLEYRSYDLIIRTLDGQFKGAHAIGYDKKSLDFWFKQLSDLKKETESMSYYDPALDQMEALTENQLVIGIDLARSIGLLEGDSVTLIPVESLLLSQLETPQFEKAIVKKIVTTNLNDLDSKLLLFNRENSFKTFLNSPSEKRGAHFWLKDIKKISQASQNLKKESSLVVESWEDKNSDLFLALKLEKTIIGLFLGLAGLIASTSILSVIAMIMSQKRFDIALIKTLGLSNQKTLHLFTKLGLWISLSALAVGTLLGVGLSLYLEYFPVNLLPQVYYDSTLPAEVSWPFVFIVLGVGSSLAFIGCYFPARASLNIHPAQLLKNK